MNFFKKLLNKFFLNKNEKDLIKIRSFLDKIKKISKSIRLLSDDNLRNETFLLKDFVKKSIEEFSKKRKDFFYKKKKDFYSVPFFKEIYYYNEKFSKEIYQTEQKILLDILPKSFAIIKETARRFKENKQLIVKAVSFDNDLSKRRSYVYLDGDKAVWKNKWIIHGKNIVWNMVHYDVQLIGGVILHQGKIAEMATGEGKTLVATLSAYLNALSGKGVHIVTVNNYLSKRDAQWMAPLMEFHGLKVDCIDNYLSTDIKRRKRAYLADITYGTNNEFGFDYLRDNMANDKNELVQRELNYAIIDEIDSVLIDEARTPLIISGRVKSLKDNKKEFTFFQKKVKIMVEKQNLIVNYFLQQSKNLIEKGENEIGGLKLFQAYRGLPKKKSLIKFLSQKNIRSILQNIEIQYIQDYGRDISQVDKDLYFVIDEKNNTVELTDKGIEFLSIEMEDEKFFIFPDLNLELLEIEKRRLPKEYEIKEKEKLLNNFSFKSQKIHTINQLLKAYTLFEKDIDYVVLNNCIKIVDEQTGRMLEGRRYSDGLHQAIEAKENVPIESSSQIFATITLQNYFRMYKKISGMTGTAETESGEFWYLYKLDVVVVPTHKPLKRIDLQDVVLKTKREKYNFIIEKIISLSKNENRPVLVGTTSVEISELLSRTLKFRKISHNVLNAKLHEKEAEIIGKAGLSGAVTIATNMAGRGTDIKLSKEVINNGGLAVLGTERHDSRRVDNQLRGRSGRQGDPGTSQFYISLEDSLIRLFFDSEKLSNLMDKFGHKVGDVIQHPLLTKSIENAQKKIEDNNFFIRKRLLDYDDVINKQREFIYKKRRNALYGRMLTLDISNMIYSLLKLIISFNNLKNKYSLKDSKNLEFELYQIFGFEFSIHKKVFRLSNEINYIKKYHDFLIKYYNKKKKDLFYKYIDPIINYDLNKKLQLSQLRITFSDGNKDISCIYNVKEIYKDKSKSIFSVFEKKVILFFLDNNWKDHLKEMENLRFSVQNAVFEQKDPLIVYKQNAFDLFEERIYNINRNIISFLFKSNLLIDDISYSEKDKK
ncbi:preprotein translocase subunit SecA [Blattabacterium cuenoti]|uniref:preprotein translocase subunit SecA n=1 Tax=Blattabacterium cuenoti TaxID=1653831 RepID=UPI00163B7D04|nr:DEAD/DEAH box helicase [Blattabacterium cuenoti]